jgi:putative spermidine/putrescine transport system ATP-binding protein
MTFIQVTHNQDEAYSLSDQIVVMDHGRIDQVGRPDEIFAQPLSQFVATFTGDNNLFHGTVARVGKDGNQALIELEVPQLGIIFCRGEAPPVGAAGACCLRSDALTLTPLDTPAEDGPSPNRFTARITAVEFTGYITRVFLALEANGQELLYKVRTADWARHSFQEGEVVTLSWTDQDCRFLAH